LSKEDLRAGEDRKLIPEGKYSAQCIKARKEMVGVETTKGTFARTPKIVLKFKIIDGQYQGEEVPMFINANYKAVPSGSKLYRSWVIANGLKKPKRRDRMALEIFKNHIFTVGVVTVKPKYKDGSEKPQVFWYSRVDEIYEKQT
jgi:hypothetical protein